MAEFDTVIRGGLVATASDIMLADVGIQGEVVTAVAKSLPAGKHEIDAQGKYVLPGGVDSHCHIEQPSSISGKMNADTFLTGTRSAACGGTTTVICFSPQRQGWTLADSTADYHERAQKAAIDYTFHLIINDPNEDVMATLPRLIADGHRSIKIFMTYDSNRVTDDGVLKLMACARENQAFLVIHAEHHEMIKWQTQRLLDAGLTDAKYHAWSKPPVVEREAVHRVISMAELLDQPVQIFHVTCAEAAEEIHRAQQRGLKIFGETCAQYLTLTADDMDRADGEGAKFVCSPSPRTPADIEALWGYLKTGVLGMVSSDHAPTNFAVPSEHSQDLKLPDGPETPFPKIPNGLPGLETRLPLLFHEGVNGGRIGLSQFVALAATNPAKLFGLYPKKGTIAPGSDADIAIWDPSRQVTIRQADLHHAIDYTPYEGWQVTGWPVTTLCRGQVVAQDGDFVGAAGHGRFLARAPYDEIAPRGVFPSPFDPYAGRR
ncbi:MAG: dihydropyrimidinase [Alphaproteobacteria bacterium]|nr:dihydropyrimidinase [Alphaproteobacteria bacterium]MCB9928784.1 dihydropyrimidinase [Alphaproteobacteria bacterium]